MSAGFQVVNHLRFFGSCQSCQSLDFNHHTLVTEKISSILCLKLLSFELNGQLDLLTKRNGTFNKFDSECFLINRFQKAGAKLALHFHGSPNDQMRARISFDFRRSQVFSIP